MGTRAGQETCGAPLWVPRAKVELSTEEMLKKHLKINCINE